MEESKLTEHIRLKCPCCGTLVKVNRIGKDYDLEAYQIKFKGYKNIEWHNISDSGKGFRQFWIKVLKRALKRLGYDPDNNLVRRVSIPNPEVERRIATYPTTIQRKIIEPDVEVRF